MEGVGRENICWVEQVSSATGTDPVTNVSETRRPVSFAAAAKVCRTFSSCNTCTESLICRGVLGSATSPSSTGMRFCSHWEDHIWPAWSQTVLHTQKVHPWRAELPDTPSGREICSCSSVCAHVYTHICIYQRVKAYWTHMHTVCLCVCVLLKTTYIHLLDKDFSHQEHFWAHIFTKLTEKFLFLTFTIFGLSLGTRSSELNRAQEATKSKIITIILIFPSQYFCVYHLHVVVYGLFSALMSR